ncbi:MAG: hypothetical protein AMS24_02935 [Chlamydiae bacterium SM23_39]|nr:MAG: hypothetical protein AMS24_02935 [Chlamydiae bacterium SM23_39]
MKKLYIIFLLFMGCQKSSNQTWENIKTAGCYFNKGISSLCGKHYESIQVENEEDFFWKEGEEYISLNEEDLKNLRSITDGTMQSKIIPGGKEIPNISKFKSPKGEWATIFKTVHFDTDDHVIKNKGDLIILQKIAKFLKKNSNIYVCVEGHCDERASAAYNMALGARRANHVRVLLIKNGIDYNRIYTVSYGKEKPKSLGHTSLDWRKNRRAEFKLFKR